MLPADPSIHMISLGSYDNEVFRLPRLEQVVEYVRTSGLRGWVPSGLYDYKGTLNVSCKKYPELGPRMIMSEAWKSVGEYLIFYRIGEREACDERGKWISIDETDKGIFIKKVRL